MMKLLLFRLLFGISERQTSPSSPYEMKSLHVFSTRPVRFGLPCTMENKENARPYKPVSDDDSDSGDGPILYRDDDEDEESKLTVPS